MEQCRGRRSRYASRPTRMIVRTTRGRGGGRRARPRDRAGGVAVHRPRGRDGPLPRVAVVPSRPDRAPAAGALADLGGTAPVGSTRPPGRRPPGPGPGGASRPRPGRAGRQPGARHVGARRGHPDGPVSCTRAGPTSCWADVRGGATDLAPRGGRRGHPPALCPSSRRRPTPGARSQGGLRPARHGGPRVEVDRSDCRAERGWCTRTARRGRVTLSWGCAERSSGSVAHPAVVEPVDRRPQNRIQRPGRDPERVAVGREDLQPFGCAPSTDPQRRGAVGRRGSGPRSGDGATVAAVAREVQVDPCRPRRGQVDRAADRGRPAPTTMTAWRRPVGRSRARRLSRPRGWTAVGRRQNPFVTPVEMRGRRSPHSCPAVGAVDEDPPPSGPPV